MEKSTDIVILRESPANNGWRKSGIAWYDTNHKLLPSGVVLQKLLDEICLKLEEIYFLEAIKCYPKEIKYLTKCNENCKIHLMRQLEIINPKVIILFGNQVSSIVLNEKIYVSKCRKKEFIKEINNKKYKCYSVFYPVGNGRFNIDKSIEDIKYIIDIINHY